MEPEYGEPTTGKDINTFWRKCFVDQSIQTSLSPSEEEAPTIDSMLSL
jgi:hypothetical protein